VKKLKEFGCNAIRTSHNPPTPELLDACDHLGMLIMDESRLLGSDQENLAKWDDQIRRDRNHASVAIWSVANEEFSVQATPQGGNVARTMQDYVQRLDPTRPVTYAAPEGDTFTGINGVIQVRGWNYHVGQDMDKYHAEHPNQPEVGTEQASTVGTRGIYENDKVRGYVSAYDDNAPSWATTTEKWWSYFADRPWLSGGFVWTGFDYRGEPTPYSWPCINSHFGILDTCGFPKDNFYYYQSWWTTNVVLHLLPHWNWPGKEGQEVRVDALSNCKQVELFLNGESQGRQTMKPNSKLAWKVKYAPGTLSAKGFDAATNVIAETKVETTGAAAAIQLTPDRSTIFANGEDVSVFTVAAVDAQGRVVPVAQNKINFALEGAGKILGVGNGDPSCHEPDTYIPDVPMRTIAVNNWRWKMAELPRHPRLLPEYGIDFDDSAWGTIKPKTDGDTGEYFLQEGQSAIYRAHVTVTAEDLASENVQVRFTCIDDHGWVYVNNQLVGESTDWSAQPIFDIKRALQPGDNIIAVAVLNEAGQGGLSRDVTVELMGKPASAAWSRSLFNGLAQVMVQSSQDAGAIKLTASAEGLPSATAAIQAVPGGARPSVP
jgi:beta-galactosidase